MECAACTIAESNPQTGHQHAGCLGCEARALANDPVGHAWEARPDDLNAAMRKVWPEEERFRRGKVLVWMCLKQIAKAKEKT